MRFNFYEAQSTLNTQSLGALLFGGTNHAGGVKEYYF
jgi:hypothetical protein